MAEAHLQSRRLFRIVSTFARRFALSGAPLTWLPQVFFGKTRGITLVLWCLFAAVLLVWPVPTEPRSLVPTGMESLQFKGPILGAPVMKDHSSDFKLPVGQDIAVDGRPLTFAKLATINSASYWSVHATDLEAYPQLFPRSIAISIANYDRLNRCNLTLRLTPSQVSRPLDCQTLKNNGLGRFEFDVPIVPGVYQATIASDGDSNNAVAPFIFKTGAGEDWVLPFEWKGDTSAFTAFRLWGATHPWQIFLYVLCGLWLLALPVFTINVLRSRPWVSLVVGVYTAVFLITAPLSGHDETAHLDMFRRAVLETTYQSPKDVELGIKDHYVAMRDYMLHQYFFRFHNAIPQAEGACSHSLIGYCGESEHPLCLYRQYARVIASTGIALSTPAALEWVGRSINYLLFFTLLSGVGLLYSRRISIAIMVTSVFSGAILAQIASVTNDVPMYLTGLWGLATLVSLLIEPRRVASWIGLMIYMGLLLVVRNIDRSWVAGIPAVAAVFLVPFRLRSHQEAQQDGALGDRSASWMSLAAWLSFLSACVLTVIGIRFLATSTHSNAIFNQLISTGSAISGEVERLRYVGMHPWAQAMQMIYSYFRSIYGSYVWGHSYFHEAVYASLVLATAYMSYLGIKTLVETARPACTFLVAVGLGLLAGTQLVAILAIASPEFVPDVVHWQSFTKVRLIAPGISCLLVTPVLGIVRLLGHRRYAFVLLRMAVIWGLILCCFYWPKFFIVDAF